ncbi:MAG: glycerol kinase GlpK [Oscillospiraceae bacterium]|nr:glycerol kinase GlpK [Oscillospiraceae bacterium]
MNGRFIIGIDQSTQGTKALLVDECGALRARADVPHRQYVDSNGWVEHDPLEIASNTVTAVRRLLKETGVGGDSVAGVAISNQRETCVAWDRKTGMPIHNAIVWQCPRAKDICFELEKKKEPLWFKERTGLNLSPYFSAGKIAWLMKNVPSARDLLRQGRLCCGTVDSWLVYRLTRERAFFTDYSNASRTQLYNIKDLKWDQEVCGLFDVDPACLATVCPSDSCYGFTDFDGLLNDAAPIHAVLGDSHAAMFGQGCHTRGTVKATYGTGSSVMLHVGDKPVLAKDIVTSIAWGVGDRVEYVMEGNLNYTGAIVTWLKDDLNLISESREIAALAALADEEDGTYLVPAFSGLGAPYWDPDSAAMLCGMTRRTGKNELARAAEEAIAYQIADVVFLMERETALPITQLCVDGGPTNDAFLMQFQSDILAKEVLPSTVEELSGVGAAYCAGIAMGIFSRDALFADVARKSYKPSMPSSLRDKKYAGWKAAVEAAMRYRA